MVADTSVGFVSASPGASEINSERSAAQAVLSRCEALGVVLSIAPGGGLAFDGPADVMGDEILAEMRAHRAELLALVALVERAASAERDAGFSPGDTGRPAEPEVLDYGPWILCPWCRSGDRLAEDAEGLRCCRCDRLAWRMVGRAIERADYVDMLTLEPPISKPVNHAMAPVRCVTSSQAVLRFGGA